LDERTLFVNDTVRRHIRSFDLDDHDQVVSDELWAELGGNPDEPGDRRPDGMKIDSEGNLYCIGPGGVHVFDALQRRLGVIGVPEGATNFTWGDDDLRTLFITASTSLYRIRVEVLGLPAF